MRRSLIRDAGSNGERGKDVLVGLDTIEVGTGSDMSWPANEHGNANATLPSRHLVAAIRSRGAEGPGLMFRSVVRRIDDDGVVCDSHVIELL